MPFASPDGRLRGPWSAVKAPHGLGTRVVVEVLPLAGGEARRLVRLSVRHAGGGLKPLPGGPFAGASAPEDVGTSAQQQLRHRARAGRFN